MRSLVCMHRAHNTPIKELEVMMRPLAKPNLTRHLYANPIARMMKCYINTPLKRALPLLFIVLLLCSTTGCIFFSNPHPQVKLTEQDGQVHPTSSPTTPTVRPITPYESGIGDAQATASIPGQPLEGDHSHVEGGV